MAVQVISLASGLLNGAMTLYTSTGVTSIVKGIRLANKDSVARVVNLYINRGTADSTDRRISPGNMSIPPGGLAIDDQEITMSAGDAIKADVNGVSGVSIDFYISGIQR